MVEAPASHQRSHNGFYNDLMISMRMSRMSRSVN